MKKVSVLDCTLRDGGYINSWKFGKKSIDGIVENLLQAKIDIIECGFIRRQEKDEDSSVFSSMKEFADRIEKRDSHVLYAVMIEHHNNVYDLIPDNDGNGADIIRVTFRIKEWKETKEQIKILINKGYKVCVQPVGTTNYDDESLISLLKDVNELKPFAFYLVDTLGCMYHHDMRRFFYLIDNNLAVDINFGFHSHNNLQMSFSNAQEMMNLAYRRSVIIDSSCYGMGRGVGNLPTELLIDYINNNIEQRYSLIPILNTIDRYLMPIYAEHRWGYDLPYFLSATAKCHPNYASYLMKMETLDIERIEKLLSLIPLNERKEFNKDIIETIYIEMQSSEVDDSDGREKLRSEIEDKEVLLLGPGQSIKEQYDLIKESSKGKYVIATNFYTPEYKLDAVFVSNSKRQNDLGCPDDTLLIATSNLAIEKSLVLNYASLLGQGDAADNAGAMLIRALASAGVKKIYLAGFDGFDADASMNYVVNEFMKPFDSDDIYKKNKDIGRQLKLALSSIDYEFLTKTKYDV